MFVLGGAVGTTFVGYRVVFARGTPLFGTHFQLPSKQELDAKLLGGAALFGGGLGAIGLLPWSCDRLHRRSNVAAARAVGGHGVGLVHCSAAVPLAKWGSSTSRIDALMALRYPIISMKALVAGVGPLKYGSMRTRARCRVFALKTHWVGSGRRGPELFRKSLICLS